jgi:hypothetical protein
MCAGVDLDEYKSEIREQVCARCIHRPPGGPPCEPLGKRCGIELDLPPNSSMPSIASSQT